VGKLRFLVQNLAFLGVDVYVFHEKNRSSLETTFLALVCIFSESNWYNQKTVFFCEETQSRLTVFWDDWIQFISWNAHPHTFWPWAWVWFEFQYGTQVSFNWADTSCHATIIFLGLLLRRAISYGSCEKTIGNIYLRICQGERKMSRAISKCDVHNNMQPFILLTEKTQEDLLCVEFHNLFTCLEHIHYLCFHIVSQSAVCLVKVKAQFRFFSKMSH